MIDTNYNIDALEYLLDKECLSERYYPLIQYKDVLISLSKQLGYKTKNDIENLSESKLLKIGFQDEEAIKLLHRFLHIYDPNPTKFKEIEKLNLDLERYLSFKELYFLPGVKQTRASLYFYSGYKTLKDIAKGNVDEILENTAKSICKYNLSYIVPLPKEIRTHIAVSKAFTQK